MPRSSLWLLMAFLSRAGSVVNPWRTESWPVGEMAMTATWKPEGSFWLKVTICWRTIDDWVRDRRIERVEQEDEERLDAFGRADVGEGVGWKRWIGSGGGGGRGHVGDVLAETARDHRLIVLEDGEVIFGEAVDGVAVGVRDVDVDCDFAGVNGDGGSRWVHEQEPAFERRCWR